MQYKVPQNVDIEDKVIAGLTLRQFMFLMMSGGGILILKYVLPSALFMPVSILIGSFGVALAFLKINDRPFEVFLLSAFNTLLKPNRRVWLKEEITSQPETKEPEVVEQTPIKENLSAARGNLQKLATLVDTGYSQNNRLQDEGVHDILQKTEVRSESFDKMMEKAKSTKPAATTDEKPISSLASVDPKENKFKYENIGLKSESELEDILKKTEQKQKEKEEFLANQKIEKF